MSVRTDQSFEVYLKERLEDCLNNSYSHINFNTYHSHGYPYYKTTISMSYNVYWNSRSTKIDNDSGRFEIEIKELPVDCLILLAQYFKKVYLESLNENDEDNKERLAQSKNYREFLVKEITDTLKSKTDDIAKLAVLLE